MLLIGALFIAYYLSDAMILFLTPATTETELFLNAAGMAIAVLIVIERGVKAERNKYGQVA